MVMFSEFSSIEGLSIDITLDASLAFERYIYTSKLSGVLPQDQYAKLICFERDFSPLLSSNRLLLYQLGVRDAVKCYKECVAIWGKYVLGNESYLAVLKNGTLSGVLSDELRNICEEFKEKAVQQSFELAKKQRVNLSKKQAELLFWLIIYRIVNKLEYRTSDEKNITYRTFAAWVGKGIDKDTLSQKDQYYTTYPEGAPGEIEIKKKNFIMLDLVYKALLSKFSSL